MRGPIFYYVSGRKLVRAGRHAWFGPEGFGASKSWANFITTTSKRHADAQYRRLKIRGRQMDSWDRRTKKAAVVKVGKQL